jgi:hypothetical protein
MCDPFPIQNGQKQGSASSPLLMNFAEYAMKKVQENRKGMEHVSPSSVWQCSHIE